MAAPAPRMGEGVVDDALERDVLGACLDKASERRRLRKAFKDVQFSIDHWLFKDQYSAIITKESYERNSRGVEIFRKCWFPENRHLEAIVCLCHGYGDTCTFFLDGIARKIASAGYGVFALDYPGFGLSEGLHGYIPSFDTLVDNVAEHFANVKEGMKLFICCPMQCSYDVIAYKDKPRLRTALEMLKAAQEIERSPKEEREIGQEPSAIQV